MLLLLMMCVLGAASVSLAGSMPPGFDDPANNPTKQKWTPKPFGPPP